MSLEYYLLWQLLSGRDMVESLGSRVEWCRDVHAHVQLVVVHEAVRLWLATLLHRDCVPPLLPYGHLFF